MGQEPYGTPLKIEEWIHDVTEFFGYINKQELVTNSFTYILI